MGINIAVTNNEDFLLEGAKIVVLRPLEESKELVTLERETFSSASWWMSALLYEYIRKSK